PAGFNARPRHERQLRTEGRHGGARGQRRGAMNFGQWMQKHRRSLLFVIALLAVGGALTALRLPISLFPNVAFPRAVVSLDAGDRPAEQMATLVTMPVEAELRRG